MRGLSSKLAVLLGLLAVLMVGVSPVTQADETDNRNVLDFQGVDTYYYTTWRQGTGDCNNAWKLINSQYQFHRDYSARWVTVRKFSATEQLSHSCTGNVVSELIDESHDACFGCNGTSANWSRLYSYNPSWPYIRRADLAMAHTVLKVTVKQPMNSSVVVLGKFCRASFRLGTTPCP